MTFVIPTFALVRPRVVVTRTGDERLLDEIVEEIAQEYGTGLVRLCGGPGSGKTTALAHLAAVFSDNTNITFLDQPTAADIENWFGDCITIAAMASGGGRHLELQLQPWSLDELIEYLLAKHHDLCGSVIERLGSAARRRWLPAVAVVVLDEMAANTSLSDPADALVRYVDALLPTARQRLAAAQYSLAMLNGSGKVLERAMAKLSAAKLPRDAKNLLRYEMVQLPLATERLRSMISNGYFGDLEQRLPRELVEAVGRRCSDSPQAIHQLTKLLSSRRAEASNPMAASILLAADLTWRPEARRKSWILQGGYFQGANWSGVNLTAAQLTGAHFTDADLKSAVLDEAYLANACFDSARLIGASLRRVRASSASFRGALLQCAKFERATLINASFFDASLGEADMSEADLTAADFSSAHLQQANLSRCRLNSAIFDDVDLTGAILRSADLTGVDLRNAVVNGACFADANMKAAQLEDVRARGLQLPNANLAGAHLTGSAFPAADLRGANLTGARLAEIDWENAALGGACLRGATFHMGSSRSGLVGSPYACEGSKTGFYTDDYEDLSFKRPEEVRKANLCGADLRGAAADGVDFYLVDLRGAKLDPKVLKQAQSTGAILTDFDA
jgi:uncharacterized protein YjbI with pentapeptide repeats